MNKEDDALQVFLALPGSDMGDKAKWKKPDDVRRFFEKVTRLHKTTESRERYRRAVRLVPELSRADVLRSPLSTLLELQRMLTFDSEIAEALEGIIADLNKEISTYSHVDGENRREPV